MTIIGKSHVQHRFYVIVILSCFFHQHARLLILVVTKVRKPCRASVSGPFQLYIRIYNLLGMDTGLTEEPVRHLTLILKFTARLAIGEVSESSETGLSSGRDGSDPKIGPLQLFLQLKKSFSVDNALHGLQHQKIRLT